LSEERDSGILANNQHLLDKLDLRSKILNLEKDIETLNATVIEKDLSITRITQLLDHAKETHRIFEYVLSKFSPELATKLQEIQEIDPTHLLKTD
jgi:hypothetical protein